MGQDVFKLLEAVLLFGVLLVILLWQWWSAARAVREDRKKQALQKDIAQDAVDRSIGDDVKRG